MTIRHLVIVKFKDDLKQEDTEKVCAAFDKLANELDIVLAYERGIQCSKEGLDGGFTDVFNLEFSDEQTRDEYVAHPKHKQFVEESLSSGVDKILVIDYPLLKVK